MRDSSFSLNYSIIPLSYIIYWSSAFLDCSCYENLSVDYCLLRERCMISWLRDIYFSFKFYISDITELIYIFCWESYCFTLFNSLSLSWSCQMSDYFYLFSYNISSAVYFYVAVALLINYLYFCYEFSSFFYNYFIRSYFIETTSFKLSIYFYCYTEIDERNKTIK